MADERKGRGRPRPGFTLERDEQIVSALGAGPLNRLSLAHAFGVNVNIIYLSLTRLRKAGRVKTIRDGKRHLWSVV